MGIYSTAHLVYGWKVPSDTWLVNDVSGHLDERLQGSLLGYFMDGSYEWADSERDLILTVRSVPSYSACESVLDLSPDAFDAAPAVDDADLRQQARDRLGVWLQGHPQWFLGTTIG